MLFTSLQLASFHDRDSAVASDSCSWMAGTQCCCNLATSWSDMLCVLRCLSAQLVIEVTMAFLTASSHSGHSPLISHVNTFHSSLRQSCFVDGSSLSETKSQQNWAAVHSWKCIPISGACDVSGKLSDVTICHYLELWGCPGQPNILPVLHCKEDKQRTEILFLSDPQWEHEPQ